MVDIGIEKVKKKGLEKKIFLMLGDGVNIDAADDAFDLTTISFGIRNFSDPQKSLYEIHRVLKNSGRLMIMEFAIQLFVQFTFFIFAIFFHELEI